MTSEAAQRSAAAQNTAQTEALAEHQKALARRDRADEKLAAIRATIEELRRPIAEAQAEMKARFADLTHIERARTAAATTLRAAQQRHSSAQVNARAAALIEKDGGDGAAAEELAAAERALAEAEAAQKQAGERGAIASAAFGEAQRHVAAVRAEPEAKIAELETLAQALEQQRADAHGMAGHLRAAAYDAEYHQLLADLHQAQQAVISHLDERKAEMAQYPQGGMPREYPVIAVLENYLGYMVALERVKGSDIPVVGGMSLRTVLTQFTDAHTGYLLLGGQTAGMLGPVRSLAHQLIERCRKACGLPIAASAPSGGAFALAAMKEERARRDEAEAGQAVQSRLYVVVAGAINASGRVFQQGDIYDPAALDADPASVKRLEADGWLVRADSDAARAQMSPAAQASLTERLRLERHALKAELQKARAHQQQQVETPAAKSAGVGDDKTS